MSTHVLFTRPTAHAQQRAAKLIAYPNLRVPVNCLDIVVK